MKKIFSEKHRDYRGIIAMVAALMLAGYTWGGFVWVPGALRTEIEATAREVLQREVSIGEIRFNPFTFTAHLRDVELAGRDGKPVLSVAKVSADLELASLWRRGAVVNKMVLSQPRLRAVVAADGTFDLSELITAGVKAKSERSVLPRLWIESLTLTKATVDFTDLRGGRSAKLQLSPLDLSLDDFRTEAGHANVYRLVLHTGSAEQLTASGKFTMQPLQITGSLTARTLTASTIDHLLGRVLPVRLATGSFDFVGRYRLALQPQFRWRLDVPRIMASAVTVNERNSESTAPLQAARVAATGFALEWPERRLRLDTLMMLQARLNVAREAGGSINLARWFQRGTGERTDPAATAVPAAAWNVAIKTIDLQQAQVAVDDELATSTAHFDLVPAHIVIANVSNATDAKASVRIATQLNHTGNLVLTGELGVAPWFASLNVEAAELPLSALQPYVNEVARLALEKGQLGFTGKLTNVPQDKAPGWRFSGRARLDGLRVQQDGVDLLASQSVAADGIDWRAQRLHIERVVAQQPAARFAVDKQGRLNMARVLRPRVPVPSQLANRNDDPLLQLALEAAGEAGAVARSTTAAPARMYLQISRIDLVDGAANVTDASITPEFSTALTALSGSVTGLSSEPAARAKLRLGARIDAQARLSVAGEVSLRAPSRFTDLTVVCRDLPVSKLDAYAARFAGYHLANGTLAMEVNYRVTEGKVSANHHVVLQDFALGAATVAPKADSLPAAVAVSLLKNRDGSITLDLPVSGRLDGPELHFPVAAWQAFAKVVNDASSAPFKTLGATAGDGEELAYVEFAPGSAEIPASEQAKIDRLASALKERPEVRLEIPFAVALQDDAVAVAWSQLTTRVPQVVQDIAALDDRAKKQLIRALEQQHARDLGRPAPVVEAGTEKVDLEARITQLEKLLLDAYAPSPTQLTGLGRARAQAVENALVATPGLPSGRVVVGGDRRPRVTAGRVRLSFGLNAGNLPGP